MATDFDMSTVKIVPYVSLADAMSQDHSNADKQFPGTHNDLNFLWAMVDCEDGKRYQMIRSLSASAAFDFTLHECSTDMFQHPRNIRFPGEADFYLGPLIWMTDDESEPHKEVLITANMTLGMQHPLTVELNGEGYVWQEEDLIDVVLTPLPMNVTTIYVPGLPDDVGYTSTGCLPSGMVNGSKIVGGYGGLDRMYCIPGISAHVSKIAELEHYWFVWGAQMADGSWETGNCMLGSFGYATATFHRQGEDPVIAVNEDVKANVVWETQGDFTQPVRATLAFGGRTFHFTGTHNAANSGQSLGIAWLHGKVQEEGGETPSKVWSTMEVIKIRATPREDVI